MTEKIKDLLLKSKKLYFFIWLALLLLITASFGYDHIYFIVYLVAATVVTLLIFLITNFFSFLYGKCGRSKWAKSILTIILIFSGVFMMFMMNIFSINKFRPGFYFEKYRRAEEAKEALVKLHPIDSDVDGLVKILERAGAKVSEIKREDIYYKEWITEDFGGVFSYEYYTKSILSPCKWGGAIRYTKNKKIINFGVSEEYLGL